MDVKRIRQFFKSYFYFSTSERKGVLVLVCLILASVLVPYGYRKIVQKPLPDIQIRDLEGPQVAESVESENQSNLPVAASVLFPFDPNTASDSIWSALGVSPKQIASIRKFQSKGGRFKKPEDLNMLFALTPEQKNKLIPWARVSSKDLTKVNADSSVLSQPKKAIIYPIEINSADSETIVALYGIGPALTHRILEYRNQLGGFLHLNQLTEVWGFDEDLLFTLKDKITINPRLAKIHDINTVTLATLQTHPYFKYKRSRIVINYRNQHGPYRTLEELKQTGVIPDSIWQKMILYLRIGE